MVFVVRLQTPNGMKRLMFQSDQETLKDLQLQVQDLTNVRVADQVLSSHPPPNVANVHNKAPTTKLSQVPLKHGDLIYLVQSISAAAAVTTTAATANSTIKKVVPAAKLTERCQHGPKGRCVHCDGIPVGHNDTTKVPCAHGPNAVCPNCSNFTTQKSDDVADWLCNHPTNAFCPKCIPKDDTPEDEKKLPFACSCNKARGQECLHCMQRGPVIKVTFMPYKQYMKEKKAMCKFSHNANATCASCADPVMPDYKGKSHCDRGHAPWPRGVCLNCAPANVHLRLQPYRHCDGISFEDPRFIQEFYREWVRSGVERQRAGILFGTYINEPEATQNVDAIRALAYSLYVPPQEYKNNSIRFLRDANEENVHAVAAAMGLQPVGWVVTTLPRSGEKYGGQVFLSGAEVRQAAIFQNRYKDNLTHSRFVTVVIEHSDQVEPKAYQVSDQAVAMERDGVLEYASDPYLLATHKPKVGELTPTVMYKDSPLQAGAEFIPDELIVKAIVMAPPNPRPLFKQNKYSTIINENQLRDYLKTTNTNDLWANKLSEFNVLCSLPPIVGLQLSLEIAKQVQTGNSRLSDATQNNFINILKSKRIIS